MFLLLNLNRWVWPITCKYMRKLLLLTINYWVKLSRYLLPFWFTCIINFLFISILRSFIKKMCLKTLQNPQENTHIEVSFLIKLKISHLEHPSVWLLLILGKWFSQSYLWFNRKSFEIKLELFYEVISSMLHKKGNDFYNLRSQQTDRNWDCCKLWSNPIKHLSAESQ